MVKHIRDPIEEALPLDVDIQPLASEFVGRDNKPSLIADSAVHIDVLGELLRVSCLGCQFRQHYRGEGFVALQFSRAVLVVIIDARILIELTLANVDDLALDSEKSVILIEEVQLGADE